MSSESSSRVATVSHAVAPTFSASFIACVGASGVLLWGWDLGNLLALYWVETGAIVLTNLLVWLVRHRRLPHGFGLAVIAVPVFMGTHLLLLSVLAKMDWSNRQLPVVDTGSATSMSEADAVALMLESIPVAAVIVMTAAHLVRAGWRSVPARVIPGLDIFDEPVSDELQQVVPFARLLFMHLLLLLGGLVASVLGAGWPLLLGIVVLHLLCDISADWRDRIASVIFR